MAPAQCGTRYINPNGSMKRDWCIYKKDRRGFKKEGKDLRSQAWTPKKEGTGFEERGLKSREPESVNWQGVIFSGRVSEGAPLQGVS